VVTAIKLPVPVAAVSEAITELETAYGRKFTIDGHLLGSIGEVVAREALGLELYGMSRGRAPTLEEAKAQFLANWQKCRTVVS
jgi:hypothetical protein